MIKIRLSRQGRKNSPCYHVVATNSCSPRDSKFLEKIGLYRPLLEKERSDRFVIKKERVVYWISVGAKPSNTVKKLLTKYGF